jgi:PmbA protein
MKREWIKIHNKETAIKVANTEIEAVRVKEIVKQGERVYQDGRIGIAGGVGEQTKDTLSRSAEENLDAGIPYPYEIEGPIKAHRNFTKEIFDSEALLNLTETILKVFKTEFDAYRFSHMVTMTETHVTMKNTKGLDLSYKDAFLEIGFLIKEKTSANLMDAVTLYRGRTFDMEAYLDFQRKYLNALSKQESLPTGRVPVFFIDESVLFGFLQRALNGEQYTKESSVFSGKLGEKLFDERVTLYQSRRSEQLFQPFFDAEGCILPSDEIALIDRGRLIHVAADKRTAAQYGLPHIGSASGEYDSKPTLGTLPLRFKVENGSAKDALKGEQAILVMMASGGDFTSDGQFASPVQGAFLFDGEAILGKLPECIIRGNLYDMLGKDYMGTFRSPLYMGEEEVVTGHYLDVQPLESR